MGYATGLYLLECYSRVAVCDVDDTAVFEAVFFEGVAHRGIVLVGVDADVTAPGVDGVEYKGGDSPALRTDGDAVDYTVRLIVQPRTVLDIDIGGVGALLIKEYGKNLSVLLYHEAVAIGDILLDKCPRRIAVPPLRGVAGVYHKFACLTVNEHNLIEVGGEGFSYFHYFFLWVIFAIIIAHFCGKVKCVLHKKRG